MTNFVQPKELVFQELRQLPAINPIKTKSPIIKFKISGKSSNPKKSYEKLEMDSLKNAGNTLEIVSMREFMTPLRPDGKKTLMNPKHIFSENRLDKLNVNQEKPHRNEDCKTEVKLMKIDSIYSDCIEDLDVKLSYFNNKIQKALKKKSHKIKEKFDLAGCNENSENLVHKQKEKSTKIFKSKALVKIRQELNRNFIENNFSNKILIKEQAIGTRKILNGPSSVHKDFSKIVIIKYSDDRPFSEKAKIKEGLEKMSMSFPIILLRETMNGFLDSDDLEKMKFIRAIYAHEPSLKLLELETFLKDLPEAENSMKHLIIFNEIRSDPSCFLLSEFDESQIFDGLFVKPSTFQNYQIDLIYFQTLSFDLLSTLVHSKSLKHPTLNLIELDSRRIYRSLQMKETKEIYLNQIQNLRNKLKSKEDPSLRKDTEILEGFITFKKNVKKQIKKGNKKRLLLNPHSAEIVKMVSNDLIKRNIQYYARILVHPFSGLPSNELAFKKISRLVPNLQENLLKIKKNSLKFEKLRVFYIDAST